MSNLDEVRQSALEHGELMERTVFIEDGHIVIDLFVLCDAPSTYDIPLDQCADAGQILSWVFQLSEKTWLTNAVLRRFVALASEQAGIDLHAMW